MAVVTFTIFAKADSDDAPNKMFLMLSCSGNSLQWNLHFWLGEETSQDESTVAAYKSVELDEAMGGGPIQHREVQGSESDLFMSYFKATGIEYLPGGIESGFNKVEKTCTVLACFTAKGSALCVAPRSRAKLSP